MKSNLSVSVSYLSYLSYLDYFSLISNLSYKKLVLYSDWTKSMEFQNGSISLLGRCALARPTCLYLLCCWHNALFFFAITAWLNNIFFHQNITKTCHYITFTYTSRILFLSKKLYHNYGMKSPLSWQHQRWRRPPPP